MRSYHGTNRRAVSISHDGGVTWGDVSLDSALIEPVCQGSLLRLDWSEESRSKGRIVFCNPASRGRERLTLRTSSDDGQTWTFNRCLYRGPSAYSCLTKMPGGRLGVLFERDRYQKMTFVVVDVEWLEAQP